MGRELILTTGHELTHTSWTAGIGDHSEMLAKGQQISIPVALRNASYSLENHQIE
jgi:hypothetical protein